MSSNLDSSCRKSFLRAFFFGDGDLVLPVFGELSFFFLCDLFLARSLLKPVNLVLMVREVSL